jgi:uncharacterized OB-fold protein
MCEKKQKSIPFREGLFIEESNKVLLLGNRCEICSQIFYPPRPFCFNCLSKKMQTIKLGNKGRLYSFTTAYMPSVHFEAPYTVGWIDLAEGMRIFAPIKKSEGQTLEIDMEMELVIDEFWQEGDRNVVGYKSRPVC